MTRQNKYSRCREGGFVILDSLGMVWQLKRSTSQLCESSSPIDPGIKLTVLHETVWHLEFYPVTVEKGAKRLLPCWRITPNVSRQTKWDQRHRVVAAICIMYSYYVKGCDIQTQTHYPDFAGENIWLIIPKTELFCKRQVTINTQHKNLHATAWSTELRYLITILFSWCHELDNTYCWII